MMMMMMMMMMSKLLQSNTMCDDTMCVSRFVLHLSSLKLTEFSVSFLRGQASVTINIKQAPA